MPGAAAGGADLLFWSPLFLVTVFSWGDTWDTGTESTPHQVTTVIILVLLPIIYPPPSGDSAPLLRARGRGAAGAAAASPRPRPHEAALTGDNRSDLDLE